MKYIVNGYLAFLCILIEVITIGMLAYHFILGKTHTLFISGFYSALLMVILIITINDAYENKMKIERRNDETKT